VGTKPIHIMGYSTGAPLALHYTLEAMEDKSTLRLPSSLVFYSPATGVSKAAPLAVWQSRIGYLFGLPKLEWNSLTPEFDPFKYGSFAVNAFSFPSSPMGMHSVNQRLEYQFQAIINEEFKILNV